MGIPLPVTYLNLRASYCKPSTFFIACNLWQPWHWVTYEDFMPEMHQRFRVSQMNNLANEDADEAVTETNALSLQYGQVAPNHQEDVGARYPNALVG